MRLPYSANNEKERENVTQQRLTSEILQTRIAKVATSEYYKYSLMESALERCRFVWAHPVLKKEIELFNPVQYSKLEAIIAENSEVKMNKSGKKLLSFLDRFVSRSATRATPARLTTSVVFRDQSENASASAFSPTGLTDCYEVRLPAKSKATDREKFGELRWNPSAILMGERWHLSAPKRQDNKRALSLANTDIVEYIAKKTLSSKDGNELAADLAREYDTEESAGTEAVQQLIDKEFLLEEAGESFRRDYCGANSFKHFENIDQLTPEELAAGTLTHYVSETIEKPKSIPGSLYRQMVEGYEAIAKVGGFDQYDAGLSSKIAVKLFETYGNTAVPVTKISEMNSGIGLEELTEESVALRPSIQNMIISENLRSGGLFVSLDQLPLEKLPERKGILVESAIVAVLWDKGKRSQLVTADGMPGVPSSSFTARFRGVPQVYANDQSAVSPTYGLDWVDSNRSMNLLRESEFASKALNVNSGSLKKGDLTPSELWVSSDGEMLHILTEDKKEVNIYPHSMVNIESAPLWLRAVLLSTATGWLRPRWTWRSFEDVVDYLPGVKWKSIVISRPKIRAGDNVSFEELNELCDKYNFGTYVRVGAYDKKPLFNRLNKSQFAALKKVLGQGDKWIYWASDEEIESSRAGEKLTEFVLRLPGISQRDLFEKRRLTEAEVQSIPTYVYAESRVVGFGLNGWRSIEFEVEPGLVFTVLNRLLVGSASYFIRYMRAGRPVIRFRFPLDDLSSQEQINALVSDGLIYRLREELHANEIERYGGLRSFSLAQTLFASESRLVAQLGSKLQGEEWSAFAQWWLISEKCLTPELPELFFDRLQHSLTSLPLSPQFIESLDQFWVDFKTTSIFAKDVRNDLAHMFLNRLGVSNDLEKRFRTRLRSLYASIEGEL